MTNLLRANFFRMRRDHVFWTCFGTVLACSVVFVFFWCREDVQRGFQVKLEQHYFNMAMSLGFFIAMFAAMFLNAEYSDGTIRNKLTVGCIRREVYLANFLTVLTSSLFFTAAWLIGGCVGIPMVGPWGFGLGGLAFHVLIIVGSAVAFAAIFTFLGMLLSRRTATVTVVLSWFALLLVASMVENTLSEPEFVGGLLMTVDGMQTMTPEPNPRYVSGALRTFYEVVRDIIPAGQAIQVQNLAVLDPLRALLCDLGVTAVFTLGGLALFERKDLK